MNISGYILKNRKPISSMFNFHFRPVPPIECKDGFKVSIQAGSSMYCTPRDSNGPWHEFELGYPSQELGEDFDEYCEDKQNPLETVYAYVPEELILKLIESHGGLKESFYV